jgi:hypothetical protein
MVKSLEPYTHPWRSALKKRQTFLYSETLEQEEGACLWARLAMRKGSKQHWLGPTDLLHLQSSEDLQQQIKKSNSFKSFSTLNVLEVWEGYL